MKLVGQFLAIVVCVNLFTLIVGFPNGAPTSSCANLTPVHMNNGSPISPQPDPSFPFNLSSTAIENEDKIKLGDPITLKLTSNFQGFLIEAHQGDSSVGTFDVLGDANIQTIDCGNGQKNAITHTNPTVKPSISAKWTPPSDFDHLKGSVEFHVTVAQTHDVFWVNHVVTV